MPSFKKQIKKRVGPVQWQKSSFEGGDGCVRSVLHYTQQLGTVVDLHSGCWLVLVCASKSCASINVLA